MLLLLPSSENKLLMSWQGPYVVSRKTRDVNYEVRIPGKGVKLYHVTLLKEWKTREYEVLYDAEPSWDQEGITCTEELKRQLEERIPPST